MTGIGRAHAYQLIKDKKLKARKVGPRRTLVLRKDLEEFLKDAPAVTVRTARRFFKRFAKGGATTQGTGMVYFTEEVRKAWA